MTSNNNFSPAKTFNSVFRTGALRTPAQAPKGDLEAWFTPPQSPAFEKEEEFDGKDIDEIASILKQHLGGTTHLTSVIAGMPQSHSLFVKPEDFKPTIPSVIAPVTLNDFKEFLSTTRGKTERFLGKKKKDTGRNLTGNEPRFDFTQPLEHSTREDSNGLTPQQSLEACYATVPEHFFNQKFDSVADSVEVLSLIDETIQNKGRDDIDFEAQITQYKDDMAHHLLEHLDLVEKCLFTQTTSRADTIFQTVTNLHSLQSMVALESGRVVTLRKHIADLRAVTTTGRDQVLRLQRKRANASALLKTLDAMKRISAAKPAMERLLKSSDYTAAFAVIEGALQILDGELNGVVSLRTLARQFREMKELIAGEMADVFVRVASDRLDANVNGVPLSSSTISKEDESKFRASLSPLVRGMVRKGNLRDALAKYRTRMMDLIKTTAKLVVAQTLDSIPQENRSDALKDMDTPKFVSFLKSTFDGLEIILNRAEIVHNAVIASFPTPTTTALQASAQKSTRKLTSTQQQQQQQQQPQQQQHQLSQQGTSLTVEEIKELTNASAAVVLKIRESAHTVVNRVLSFRNDQHGKLSPGEFKMVFDAVQDFINTTGEPANEIRAVIGQQCDVLLNALDERQTTTMRSILDGELWEAQTAVPREIQNMVTRFESGRVVVNDISIEDGTRGSSSSSSTTEGGGETARRHLVVAGRNVKVTGASINMIKFLQEYVRCALMFPPISFRAATRCFDFLIVYDERIRRLILGAEVQQKGLLKTILAKHLAMASQSLTAIYLLLAPISKIFIDSVPAQQQVRVEEDLLKRVEKNMADHINAISETLISLITNQLLRLTPKIRETDWDAKGTEGLDKPQQYMVDFTEQVTKFHTLLSANFDKVSLEEIFQGKKGKYEGVFAVINQRIPEQFQNVNPKTPAGLMRVRVDILHLVSSLRRLRGAGQGTFTLTLEDWVTNKYGKRTSSTTVPTVAPPASNPPG